MNAAYNKVPDVKTEVVYRAISAPSDSIRPIVEVKGDTAIDTRHCRLGFSSVISTNLMVTMTLTRWVWKVP